MHILTENNNNITNFEHGHSESTKNSDSYKHPIVRRILKCATHIETKSKANKMKGGKNILEKDKIEVPPTFLQKPKLIKKDEELINYSSKLEMLLQKERKENMEKRASSISLDHNKLKFFLKNNENNDAIMVK